MSDYMEVSFPSVEGATSYKVYGAQGGEITVHPVGETTTIAVYADGTWIVNGEEWDGEDD
jgi:hypothetical protein